MKSKWYERVNVSALSDNVRVLLLETVKEKYGFNETLRLLGIVKSSLHRYLKGKRRVPDELVRKILTLITEEEFKKALRDLDLLKSLGLLREDGSIDYKLVMEVIAIASRDEYVKKVLLEFIVREFRDDLRRMLGMSLLSINFVCFIVKMIMDYLL